MLKRNSDSTARNAVTVMKFGGTSVKDREAFARVAELVRVERASSPVAVVVSAMSGVTDALLRSTEAARIESAATGVAEIAEHLARYEKIAEELLSNENAAVFRTSVFNARRALGELLDDITFGRVPLPVSRDAVLSFGERLSAELLAHVLGERGALARCVDARRVIVTDEQYEAATPLFDLTAERTRTACSPLIEAGVIPVLGGFIGATQAGATTTLGRGGSDYSAALVGAALDAGEIQIWTDVPGVLTADPRVVKEARIVPRLSYREAAELAYFGAKVLHPKTIQPAIEKSIPVRVCNSQMPEAPATIISADAEVLPGRIKAIAHKTGIIVMQITSARMLGAYGFLRRLFEVFERRRVAVDVVTTSEVSVSLTFDDDRALDDLIIGLRQLGTIEVERRQAIICVVGEGLRLTPGIAARVLDALGDINVTLISLGASNVNLTCVVDEQKAGEAVRRLHAAFFSHPREASAVG